MRKRIVIATILVLVVGIGGILYLRHNGKANDTSFQFVEVTRSNLETSISCTGTLNAVGTVEVGTQVSGTIAHLFVDYNDHVQKGQMLAKLDTTVLKAAVVEADADLAQAQAQFEQAVADYDRNLPLKEKGYLSEAELLPLQTTLKTRQAALESSRAKLKRARQNLEYAYIRSPISGTVIQRNIEQGQTVAASLSAPTLFVIAEDLSKMEIHTLVDESDIGVIEVGQPVRFVVPTYYDKSFEGTVRQVRLQPDVVQNVVNYTVIVDAANNDNLLLPGMTATVNVMGSWIMASATWLSMAPKSSMMRANCPLVVTMFLSELISR